MSVMFKIPTTCTSEIWLSPHLIIQSQRTLRGLQRLFNPISNKPWFLCTSLLKTLLAKEK